LFLLQLLPKTILTFQQPLGYAKDAFLAFESGLVASWLFNKQQWLKG
jgi:hypothetical protein